MNGAPDRLADLRAQGLLSDLDLHFARLLGRLGEGNADVLLAAAVASRWTGEGHVCAPLEAAAADLEAAGVPCPTPAQWRESLESSVAVGRPGGFRPLVLDGAGRLYLYRYWAYEQGLAENLRARAQRRPEGLRPGTAAEALSRLFPRPAAFPAGLPDGQKTAAAVALLRSLCVISGGPGTGKTTAVVRLLALLVEQAEQTLRIALAAPTGKAAARLQEAVKAARDGLPCDPAVRAAIPAEASTLHRLLGSRPGSAAFRYGPQNPLPHDVVVVDEVSMVDLALMAKLAGAVRPGARLLLLGDRDQLSSVEAGSVLGDLCDTGAEHGYSPAFAAELEALTGEGVGTRSTAHGRRGSDLGDCVALLRWSHRFDERSGIGRASRAVNAGSAEEALDLLRAGPGTAWRDAPPPAALSAALGEVVAEGFSPYLRARGPADALEALGRFRVLCALREGPFGADTVSRAVEQALARRGLVDPREEWYAGRPVLITANDRGLRLFNGDVGVALPDPDAAGSLRVFFPGPEGPRAVAPRRLPPCETVYAMTVHKSQGSEFGRVLLLLGDRSSRVLTRELLYTGLTRARQTVEVWGAAEVFRRAVETRTRRSSGLRDALWGRG